MIYNLFISDLASGLNSLRLLPNLEDMIYLAHSTKRLSLPDELPTRFSGKTHIPSKNIVVRKELDQKLIEFIETADDVVTVDILNELRADFIYLQEYIYSSIPEFAEIQMLFININRKVIQIKANYVKNRHYTFD